MKQLIERLRVLLHDAHEEGEIGGDAFHALAICAEANLPQLLDRLEKLEAVAEAATDACRSIPGMLPKIEAALTALENQ